MVLCAALAFWGLWNHVQIDEQRLALDDYRRNAAIAEGLAGDIANWQSTGPVAGAGATEGAEVTTAAIMSLANRSGMDGTRVRRVATTTQQTDGDAMVDETSIELRDVELQSVHQLIELLEQTYPGALVTMLDLKANRRPALNRRPMTSAANRGAAGQNDNAETWRAELILTRRRFAA